MKRALTWSGAQYPPSCAVEQHKLPLLSAWRRQVALSCPYMQDIVYYRDLVFSKRFDVRIETLGMDLSLMILVCITMIVCI